MPASRRYASSTSRTEGKDTTRRARRRDRVPTQAAPRSLAQLHARGHLRNDRACPRRSPVRRLVDAETRLVAHDEGGGPAVRSLEREDRPAARPRLADGRPRPRGAAERYAGRRTVDHHQRQPMTEQADPAAKASPQTARDQRTPVAQALVCPKCQGAMKTYVRSRGSSSSCARTAGACPDRGELERLIDSEGGGWSGILAEPVDRTGLNLRRCALARPSAPPPAR